MSVHDERPEHAPAGGAMAVLAVSACGLAALPLVVVALHVAGLSWLWAGAAGFFTPSLFLLLWGVVVVAVRSAATAPEVVRPLHGRGVELRGQAASAA